MFIKKLLATAAMLWAVASFAAVDANRATAEELDGVKGIGPVLAKKIVDERSKSRFKSWDDFVSRVKGTGGGNAAKLSAAGLTVDGRTRDGAAPQTEVKPTASAPVAMPMRDQKPSRSVNQPADMKNSAPAMPPRSDIPAKK